MKKKLWIGSIFAALLILSMPVISNIQAQSAPDTTHKSKETEECSICAITKTFSPYPIICRFAYNTLNHLNKAVYYDGLKEQARSKDRDFLFNVFDTLSWIHGLIGLKFLILTWNLVEDRGIDIPYDNKYMGFDVLGEYCHCLWDIDDFPHIPWDESLF
jgi:hypothetical protein